MSYTKITIKPTSPFSSYPHSDMVFGQICCTLKYMGEDLNKLLGDYKTSPFFVVSDMFMNGLGNAPLKPHLMNKLSSKSACVSSLSERKKAKKQNKIAINNLCLSGKPCCFETDKTFKTFEIVRNSINRQTGTTTGEEFTPYASFINFFSKASYFDLYFYTKDGYKEMIIEAIKLMGKFGFGKDSSTGSGFFEISDAKDILIKRSNTGIIYTLSNMVLEDVHCDNIYYEPFTRFGRHGSAFAGGVVFKNPIVMAKQGALIFGMANSNNHYIGKGLDKISSNLDINAVHQGYSLYIDIERGWYADFNITNKP